MNDEYTAPLDSGMDNLLAHRLGAIAFEAGNHKEGIGDSIDRGLVLRRLLEEQGFYLVVKKDVYNFHPPLTPY